MRETVLSLYKSNLAELHFEPDAAQARAARQLDELANLLNNYRLPPKRSMRVWFSGASRGAVAPHGLYIWGEVGRGKTMLMDLFFQIAPIELKRRVHFHAFMADVHARIHAWRQKRKLGEVKGDDPIAPVAHALSEEASLLCFDEFSVTDIADAMILARLFEALFALGVVMVATSNVEPNHLYRDGLNRALFLPFIQLLQTKTEVLHLDAARDFRLHKLAGTTAYFVPADKKAHQALNDLFELLRGASPVHAVDLPLLGRFLHVPKAAAGIARFSFAELCEAPLSTSDYLELARQFHTLIIDHIPIIDADNTNIAKRFINLVDTLYDYHVKLFASADAVPSGIYQGSRGYEAFEFSRTISRLTEMASQDYLSGPHGAPISHTSGSSAGLVDT